MSLDLTWLGCDLVSGRIIEELPDLRTTSLSAVLATYTSATFELPLALGGNGRPPTDWQGATEEGRTMVVAVLGGYPIWAGQVTVNKCGSSPVAQISCATLHAYLDRRYVGDHEWVDQDEASVIMAGLAADAATEGVGFVVDAPATGTLRQATYKAQDDKTVYSALRSEMGAQNGPEWDIALGWTDANQTAVSKTIVVRKRIGRASETPNAVFDSRGESEVTYEQIRDYSSSKGANHVVAVSSGQGDARPESSPARNEELIAAGMPRWEYRWTPSTSITEISTLDSHAASAVALMAHGSRTVNVTARADATPMLGRDWSVGDDIGYDLVGHGHPDGLAGVSRCIGWTMAPEAGTISPILLVPGDEPGGV